jgi:hypothetical protein
VEQVESETRTLAARLENQAVVGWNHFVLEKRARGDKKKEKKQQPTHTRRKKEKNKCWWPTSDLALKKNAARPFQGGKPRVSVCVCVCVYS